MASSVTAPLERQFGQVPGLNQMTSTSSGGSLGRHAAIRARPRTSTWRSRRCRRQSMPPARFLPRDLPNPPIYSKVNPADTPILTLALDLRHAAALEGRGPRRHPLAQKISQLPGVGLVSISGGQKPAVRIQANPTALASYGLEPRRPAHGARPGEREPGQGQLRRRRIRRTRSARTTSLPRATTTGPDHRLPQRAPVRLVGRGRRRRRRRERQPGGVDERRLRRSSSTSSASPAPTSSRSSTASSACCRSSRPSLPSAVAAARCSPTAPRRSAPRSRTSSSS